jgi:sugar lactone lactonase YvrE
MTEITCVAALQARLGEGPFWDSVTQQLYWFDIRGKRLFALDDRTGEIRDWSLPCRASAGAAFADGSGLLISAEDGLWRFNPATGARVQAEPEPRFDTGFRSNDGKADPAGGFWWSTMDDDGGKRPGSVYRFDGMASHRMFGGIHIANSLAFSPDGRTGYVSDSARKIIWRFDVDLANNWAGERVVFAQVSDAGADPDGAAMDAEGFLWVAIWGGSRVDRYAPDGTVDRSLAMPVTQPSCPAFGGPDLDTLYITSAWDGLSDEARAAQPLAGGLFAAKVGVRGLAIPPIRAEP